MRRTSVFIVCVVAVALCRAWAAPAARDAQVIFSNGCDLYDQGNFGQAAEHFEALVARGIEDSDVYYNLANAYYKQGRLGKAVANYRRALVLAPRDDDARANLELLRSMVGFRDTTTSYDAADVAVFPLRLASPREFQAISYVGYYMAALAIVVALFSRGLLRRRTLQVFVALAIITAAGFMFARYGISRTYGDSDGVVAVDQAEMMSGPGTAFDELIRLPDGVEVRLRARSGIWVEIELRSGEIGWIREQDIELI
jgi:hypothetical protein